MTVNCPALVIFLSAISVSASPVASSSGHHSLGGFTHLLIVVLALLFTFVLLMFVKYLYLKQRRVECLQNLSESSLARPDSHRPSSGSRACQFHADFEKNPSCNQKAGVLVGMLGSPAWETKIKSEMDKAARRQRRSVSFMYQLQRESHRRHSQVDRQPRNSGSSVADSRRSNTFSFSGFTDACSIQLPASPIEAHTNSRRCSFVRRFSSHSAKTDTAVGSYGEKSSLRLVGTAPDHDLLLPLSPTQEKKSSTPSSPSAAISKTDSPDKEPPQASTTSPSPPSFYSSRLSPCEPSIPTFPIEFREVSVPTPVFISCPRALAPKTKRTPSVSNSRGSRGPSQVHISEPLALAPRQPFTAVTARHVNAGHLPVLPLMNFTPPLPSFAFPIPPAHTVPVPMVKARLKQQGKRVSQVRTRKPSIVRPSPLRTMVLPDGGSSGEIGCRQDVKVPREQPEEGGRIEALADGTDAIRGSLGLGFPPRTPQSQRQEADMEETRSAENSSNDSTQTSSNESRHSEDSYRQRQSTRSEDGSTMLLGIIRELVEEAHTKDAQYHEQSGTKKSAADSSGSTTSDSEYDPEIELRLLGLDRFKKRRQRGFGGPEKRKSRTPEDSLVDLISFWEDEPVSTDDGVRRECVGTAL